MAVGLLMGEAQLTAQRGRVSSFSSAFTGQLRLRLRVLDRLRLGARLIGLERGIFADLSIVKAWKADETGNVVFRKTARNFNMPAATCGKICVAEVEQIVPTGELDPDLIHTPGIYVHRIIQGEHEKRIEPRTVRAA